MSMKPPTDYWKRLVRVVLGMTLAAVLVPLVLALVALWGWLS